MILSWLSLFLHCRQRISSERVGSRQHLLQASPLPQPSPPNEIEVKNDCQCLKTAKMFKYKNI